jgi:hypothetical protein
VSAPDYVTPYTDRPPGVALSGEILPKTSLFSSFLRILSRPPFYKYRDPFDPRESIELRIDTSLFPTHVVSIDEISVFRINPGVPLSRHRNVRYGYLSDLSVIGRQWQVVV